MSEDDNNGSELRYEPRSVEELIGSGHELSGFAEAAIAFQGAGVQYAALALNLVVNQPAKAEAVITADQIEALIAKVVALAAGQVNNPNVANFIADARNSVGASLETLAGLTAEGLRCAENAKGDLLDSNSPETREETIARLWGELEKTNKKLSSQLDVLHEKGILSDEEHEAWDKRLKAINEMPDGPEKAQALKQYYADLDKDLARKEDQARAQGDEGKVTSIVDARKTVGKAQDTVQEMEVAGRSQDKKMETGAATQQAQASVFAAAPDVPAVKTVAEADAGSVAMAASLVPISSDAPMEFTAILAAPVTSGEQAVPPVTTGSVQIAYNPTEEQVGDNLTPLVAQAPGMQPSGPGLKI